MGPPSPVAFHTAVDHCSIWTVELDGEHFAGGIGAVDGRQRPGIFNLLDGDAGGRVAPIHGVN